MRTGREVWSQMFSKCRAFLASKSYMSSKIKYDSTSGTVSNSRDTSPSCSVCRSRGMRLGGRQFEAWGMGHTRRSCNSANAVNPGQSLSMALLAMTGKTSL